VRKDARGVVMEWPNRLVMTVMASLVAVAANLIIGGEPMAWHLAGSSPEDYVVGVDHEVVRPGKSAFLRSQAPRL
jgi:hypothetical protein